MRQILLELAGSDFSVVQFGVPASEVHMLPINIAERRHAAAQHTCMPEGVREASTTCCRQTVLSPDCVLQSSCYTC